MNQEIMNSMQIMKVLSQNQNMKAMVSTLIQDRLMMKQMNNILNLLIYNYTIENELKEMLNLEMKMNMMNIMNVNDPINMMRQDNIEKETFLFFFEKMKEKTLVSCKPSDKFADVIEKYRKKSFDNDESDKFIYNSQRLDPKLTVEELGISNYSYITVFSSQGKFV